MNMYEQFAQVKEYAEIKSLDAKDIEQVFTDCWIKIKKIYSAHFMSFPVKDSVKTIAEKYQGDNLFLKQIFRLVKNMHSMRPIHLAYIALNIGFLKSTLHLVDKEVIEFICANKLDKAVTYF